MANSISIENARILPGNFRNFSGKESKFNTAGDRNFCVELDPELAEELKAEGWNIKYLRPRTEDDEPTPYTQVKIKYGYRPPVVFIISGKVKTEITEEEDLDMLDWADIEHVDLVIRPYEWEAHGTHGVKGYLKTMYVTISKDEFADKYAEQLEMPF